MAEVEPGSDQDEPAVNPVRAGARRATAKAKAAKRKATEKVEDAKAAATDAFDKVIDSLDELNHRDT
jgi:hypothetical protein